MKSTLKWTDAKSDMTAAMLPGQDGGQCGGELLPLVAETLHPVCMFRFRKRWKTGLSWCWWEGEARDSLRPTKNASQPDLGAPSV